MAELLFYVLSAATVALGIGVVSARNPIMSVIALLGAFVCLAGIYLLAGFQFLAAAQLIVYAGAIMVLFLFVIMLLNLGDVSRLAERPTLGMGRNKVALAAIAAAALALVGIVGAGDALAGPVDPTLVEQGFDPIAPGELGPGIAGELFSRYAIAFQAAGLLLLATLVAVVVLAKRQRGGAAAGRKSQAMDFSLGDPS